MRPAPAPMERSRSDAAMGGPELGLADLRRAEPGGRQWSATAALGSRRYVAHCGSPSWATPIKRQCAPRGTAGGTASVQPSSSSSRSAFRWLHDVHDATQFSQEWGPPRLRGTT